MNNLKKKIVYLSLLGLLAATGTAALASEGRRGGELRRSDDDGVRQRVLRVRDLGRRAFEDNDIFRFRNDDRRSFDDTNLTRQEKINLEMRAGDDKGGLRNTVETSGRDSVRVSDDRFDDNSGRSERTIFDDNSGRGNGLDDSGRRVENRIFDDSGRHGDDFGLREFDDRGGRR
ncbi:MAG: hypothetical protein WC745_03925 [Patescibacteria group bacterium]|jgi:hypothetical protein